MLQRVTKNLKMWNNILLLKYDKNLKKLLLLN